MRASRIVSTVALSMCVAGLVGGCAGGDGSGDAVRSVPRTAQARDDLLKSAQNELVRRCLTDREVEAPAPVTTSAAPQPAGGQRQFPYGIDDPAWAAEHGFGITAGSTGQGGPATPKLDRKAAAEQQRLSDALFGTGRRELSTRTATGLLVKANSDGCLAQAQRVLYGDQAAWFRTDVTVNNLAAAAHQRVTRDPAYRAALADWSRCIAPVHKATDPAELRSAWQRGAHDLDARRAAALQRRYAVAEARCVRRTGLAGTGVRLERWYTAELRAQYADQLDDHRRLREHGLRYAVQHGL
ncbi:hypothetical protein [Streptomyces cylindrosporus]|uniref:Lipoprotein n=1 Tax=Streptomyces cylindrosporus TaxID=2927583 RepID=A0ABS9YL42_9ACTN|nr:hypothetical protein [Streptomyces cylindrosporus]MCI3277993.1 hypothetical protein [Streptomyces cylindrosporus]